MILDYIIYSEVLLSWINFAFNECLASTDNLNTMLKLERLNQMYYFYVYVVDVEIS